MERHEILEAMSELKLYGMRASFDEIAGKGLARRDKALSARRQPGRAGAAHRQARSISYRIVGAKLPVSRHRQVCSSRIRLSMKAKFANSPPALSSTPNATRSSSAAPTPNS